MYGGDMSGGSAHGEAPRGLPRRVPCRLRLLPEDAAAAAVDVAPAGWVADRGDQQRGDDQGDEERDDDVPRAKDGGGDDAANRNHSEGLPGSDRAGLRLAGAADAACLY